MNKRSKIACTISLLMGFSAPPLKALEHGLRAISSLAASSGSPAMARKRSRSAWVMTIVAVLVKG